MLVATILAWKENSSQILRKPINIGLAVLLVWLIFIALFASDRLEAFLGLANFVPFFLFFAAFNTIIKTTQQLREFSWAIAIGSVPVLILGFAEQFLHWSTLPQLQFLLGWVLTAGGNPPGRMASVFIYANTLAIYLVIVFSLTLGLWLKEWQLFKSKFPQNPQFILLTLVLLSSTIALIFTKSRNAWGLTIFIAIAYALYLSWYWLIGVISIPVASVFGAAFGSPPGREWLRAIVPAYFWARLSDRYFPNRPIASLRTTQWQFAWNLTRERPLTGWGLRNFTPIYEAKMNFWLGHPHNLVLMLACETGLPATLFFCAWVGWILAQGVLLLFDPPRPPLTRGEKEEDKGEGNMDHSPWTIPHSQDRLILFSYLVAFGACTLFNLFDVTLFDLRINAISWLLLAAICGISCREKAIASQ